MGIPSRQPVHARHRDGTDCRHDPREAQADGRLGAVRLLAGLIGILLAAASPAAAETLRIATYHAELARDGPGLLLRDILSEADPQVEAVIAVIAAADADVLLLLGFDYDHGQAALDAFAARLAARGASYPFRFAARPNTGVPSGLDLDGDGRLGGAADAWGFGFFAGQGGMALLSRLPIRTAEARDFTGFLWQDLPGAILLPDTPPQQPLSTTGHWDVPVQLPDGSALHLLGWHASPPVFDGPEDRNGRRNHDEAAFWLRYLEGAIAEGPPESRFVLLGDANLDPGRSDGRAEAMRALLGNPLVRNPAPRGAGATATADFSADGGPGMLRVDYVLPSADLDTTASGVLWPAPGQPLHAEAVAASRHRLVWVDIDLP